MKLVKSLLALVVILGAIGGVSYWVFGAVGNSGSKAERVFTTQAVRVGTVEASIAASGTIEPQELVDVGSQVSGQILKFGTDLEGNEIDYCSVVTNGMVLARIDDVTYLADLDVARAQLSNAVASVAASVAGLEKAKVEASHAKKDWQRAQKIGVGIALSQSDYDGYQASFESAEANVLVAEASVRQSEAGVVQAKASLEKAERNLGYCTITAPTDGIIIDRRVNLGQTVVSSMSVSSLFLVAKDLKHLRIWAAVNEADIGSIKVGQEVRFTVDTFDQASFTGTVRRIRLNATVTSNVVTYTVEIDVENPDEKLIPYLTANVEFITQKEENALVVPARALRFRPEGAPPVKREKGIAVLWVAGEEKGALPKPVCVKVLLNNGSEVGVAPVNPEELKDGMKVVTHEQSVAKGAKQPEAAQTEGEGANNPFMPKMPKPPKRR